MTSMCLARKQARIQLRIVLELDFGHSVGFLFHACSARVKLGQLRANNLGRQVGSFVPNRAQEHQVHSAYSIAATQFLCS
eukprot:4961914-Amphidinium_carterae.1